MPIFLNLSNLHTLLTGRIENISPKNPIFLRPNQISQPTILTASIPHFSEKFLVNEYRPTSIVWTKMDM